VGSVFYFLWGVSRIVAGLASSKLLFSLSERSAFDSLALNRELNICFIGLFAILASLNFHRRLKSIHLATVLFVGSVDAPKLVYSFFVGTWDLLNVITGPVLFVIGSLALLADGLTFAPPSFVGPPPTDL